MSFTTFFAFHTSIESNYYLPNQIQPPHPPRYDQTQQFLNHQTCFA